MTDRVISPRLALAGRILKLASLTALLVVGWTPSTQAQEHIEKRVGDINMPKWSPDAKQVAFYADWDGDWDIYVLVIASNDVRQLTHNSDANDYHPVFSLDGKTIYYTSNIRGDYDIHAINVETGQSRYLFGEPGVSEFRPQEILGGKIAFNLGTREEGRKLALWDPETNEVEVVSEGPMKDGKTTVNEWGAWSPTGNFFAYGADRNRTGVGQNFFDLYVADWDGTNERKFMSSGSDHEGFGGVVDAIFPDGKRILFHADKDFELFNPHLYIYDFSTNTETKLPKVPDVGMYFPGLSSDGTMMVMGTDVDDDGLVELVVMDTEGREMREIWPKKRLIWSAD